MTIEEAARTGPAAEGRGDGYSGLRFLVAEDHEFQRESLMRLLSRLGASAVYGAHDGASTLRALQDPAHVVDILLLDLAMPGMDGVELLRNLGASRNPLGVILNSSFDAAFLDAIKLLGVGFDVDVLGVAEKPLTDGKLRPLLDAFIAKKH